MNINYGYYLSLSDEYRSRQLFSASTGNFEDDDFLKLWELVGRRVLASLKAAEIGSNDEPDNGRKLSFRIEATKL